MPRVDPPPHHVVCGALVRDGRILLAHRSPAKAWYPNVWDFPGGHVEPGETSREALVRELREELGVRVTPPAAGTLLTIRRDDLLLEIWRFDEWAGEITNAAPEEHDALGWFGGAEAQSLELADPQYPALIERALRATADHQTTAHAGVSIRAITALNGTDSSSVSSLIEAYLRHTEAEKAAHGLGTFTPGDPLPDAYAQEVRRPDLAFAGATVLLASRAGRDVAVAVLRPLGVGAEIKRLWVHPDARGTGVGRAILDEIVRREPAYLRLSVWSWREVARRAYRRSGFAVVPGWDQRPQLVCMERRGTVTPAVDTTDAAGSGPAQPA
jgi:8-oxo-dGTP diphosphatase